MLFAVQCISKARHKTATFLVVLLNLQQVISQSINQSMSLLRRNAAQHIKTDNEHA